MATRSESRLQKLEAENRRLRRANDKLQKQFAASSRWSFGRVLRKFSIVLCVTLAILCLTAGNILFWAGNTIVKSDRYVAATAPIIRNPSVQNALATNINQKLFAQVDVNRVVSQALPPRAGFLAPVITDQVHQHSQDAIKKVLARPQFQDRWNAAQEHIHDRFIKLVDEHGSDGSINVSEVYTDVSQQLVHTNLAFLANKPLPAKAGQIQLLKGKWLSVLQRTIQHIDTWRLLALGLLIIFSFIGIWLSARRRRTAIVIASLAAAAMFLTLLCIRIGGELIAGKVKQQNAEAVRQIYGIVTHSLVAQTAAILGAAPLMIFIIWISGTSSAASRTKVFLDRLFSGKLHAALFSKGENALTHWTGAHKVALQWSAVALVVASILFTRLTPGTLVAQAIAILMLVLLVEVLAAK